MGKIQKHRRLEKHTMRIAFELSEYLFSIGILLVAYVLTYLSSPIPFVLALILLLIAIYGLVLRSQADYEHARVQRIIGAMLIVGIGLTGSGPFALLIAGVGLITAFIAFREHRTYHGYIPVERA